MDLLSGDSLIYKFVNLTYLLAVAEIILIEVDTGITYFASGIYAIEVVIIVI